VTLQIVWCKIYLENFFFLFTRHVSPEHSERFPVQCWEWIFYQKCCQGLLKGLFSENISLCKWFVLSGRGRNLSEWDTEALVINKQQIIETMAKCKQLLCGWTRNPKLLGWVNNGLTWLSVCLSFWELGEENSTKDMHICITIKAHYYHHIGVAIRNNAHWRLSTVDQSKDRI